VSAETRGLWRRAAPRGSRERPGDTSSEGSAWVAAFRMTFTHVAARDPESDPDPGVDYGNPVFAIPYVDFRGKVQALDRAGRSVMAMERFQNPLS